MTLTYWSAPDLLGSRFNFEDLKITKQELKGNKLLSHIHKIACNDLMVNEHLVRGKLRKQELVQARQVIFYLGHKYTKLSLKLIGKPYSGRDHSTILHNIQQLHNLMDTEPKVAELVKRIEQKII